jgi:hypothetical protein
MAGKHLTPQQEKWFASILSGLEAETGKSLPRWVEIAKTCPHATHKKRLEWLKAEHGLGVNRASAVLDAAFGAIGWSDPDALIATLWSDPAARVIFDRIASAVGALDDVVVGPRKGYTAFSRRYQFAAARPTKNGVRLGLAVAASASPRLSFAKPTEGWSERLISVLVLTSPDAVDDELAALLRAAHAAS